VRIALVHMRHRRRGGTERFLNELARRLAECGHDVVILCRSHEAAPDPRVSFQRLEPFSIGASWRMWAFARAVEARVRSEHFDLVLGLGKTWTHDVIRLGGGCHASYLERTGARLRFKDRLALRIEARALAPDNLARVIANSRMVRDDVMRRYGVPQDAIEVVYNGVDLDRFRPSLRAEQGMALRTEWGLSPEQRVLLFLGTGFERKGLDRTLEAFRLLCEHDARTQLVVVGHSSRAREWQARAIRLGLEKRVSFLGARDDPERCFAAADAYVLPTRYDPFANSTLEALACGVPAVTTPDNGAAELLDDESAGSVVRDPDNPESLGRAVERWLDCEPNSTRARAVAEAHSASEMARRTIALLEEVARRS